jgi:uncharacterized phiE125 gp8 family phage protein
MTVTLEGTAPLAVPIDALKDYLRISRDDEDALLESLIRAASGAAERFIGAMLIVREVNETLGAAPDWRRLAMGPVRAITSLAGVPAEGSEFPLPVESYGIDIDGKGDGWVRVTRPGAAGRVRVTYEAGMANAVEDLPEPIRHGIIRFAGELHASREGLEVRAPSSVEALWRPWRRMRLS